MLVHIDQQTANENILVCRRCYGLGHKGNDCRYDHGELFVCPTEGCGKNHYPRDFYHYLMKAS